MELLMSETSTVQGSRWLLLHAAVVFAFLYLPIAVLIIYSFNGAGVGGFPPRDLTLNWYRTLLADGAIWESVGNSLLVALAAVGIALALGIPAALALDRAQFPGKALFRRLVLLPLILPGIITGLSLLMLFHTAQIKLSLLTIVLGHGTALISVATTEVFAGLQKLDRAQEEASLDLGANYIQTFWRVTLPNLKLSIIGAALLFLPFRWTRFPSVSSLSGGRTPCHWKSGLDYGEASPPRLMPSQPSSLFFRWWQSCSGIDYVRAPKARPRSLPSWSKPRSKETKA